MRCSYILLFSLILMLYACGEGNKDKSVKATNQIHNVKANRKAEAQKTVVTSPSSKGVIESLTDVPVYSLLTSVVEKVSVKQGQRVHAGDLLFTLNSTDIHNEINLCKSQIQQARFQYESILVGQGYDISNTAAIPEKILNAARIRSNLPVYEEQLKIHRQQLGYTTIKAPVSGVVTEVPIRQHGLAEQGVPLCNIVDPENLRVTFTVLESEIGKFAVGSIVNVTTISYPGEIHKATITDIKPKVEETGMIIVRAKMQDSKHLMVGMTAMVTLQ